MIESSVNSNNNLSQSLGQLKSFKQTDLGLEGTTANGQFKVVVYDHGIIRIHISFSGQYDEASYAVVASPRPTDFNLLESESEINISTSLTELRISKNPVRFNFYTINGEIINEDDAAFGTSIIGEQVTSYKKLQVGERFIGLGEKTGPLDRRGHGYQHWNTDNFGYPPESDPLYCSTPFYMGIHSKKVYGIFLDNSHKTHFNFGASNNRFSSFSADSGDINYYFIYDKGVDDIISSYSYLTGLMVMPPKWGIGYQQCRYSYYPDKEVTTLAQTFRDKDIPADVIVLDIHYMDAYKIFTWDKARFPDPKGMVKQLREQGFHIVVMCDPGIKVEEGYEPYESGKQKDLFVKYPDGTYYQGEVWPGWCHFPDFTKPETRDWWKENLTKYTEIGVDGFWNDMNEIATWGQMLPELIEFDFEGEKATARKGRNIYGLQMAKSTYEGTKALMNKRPFNLTRSGFSGIQRYAAVWTGDNVANDEHMLLGVRLVNSMGLTGIAFAGYDVGGFAGNANEQLFARWIQLGAFSPFFRGHSMINSRDSEPWAYGEEVEEISRNYIKLRYKLMGYIYSIFKEAATTGMPISRSLAINYTHDDMIYHGAYHNQYLFGPSILVVPVESYKQITKAYLPKGQWYNFFTDEQIDGNQEIYTDCGIEQLPLFVKASAIIPVYPNAGVTTHDKGQVLEIHVYAGEDENQFIYYEDDGETFEFENGNFYQRIIQYKPKYKSISLTDVEGNFDISFKTIKYILHGFDQTDFQLNGQKITASTSAYQFINPVSKFDPVGEVPEFKLKSNHIKVIETTHSNKEQTITW